jgi:predicted transcriptional regulator
MNYFQSINFLLSPRLTIVIDIIIKHNTTIMREAQLFGGG